MQIMSCSHGGREAILYGCKDLRTSILPGSEVQGQLNDSLMRNKMTTLFTEVKEKSVQIHK